MGKNYDLIATVSIDINNPIVDDTSFDNILIVGPLPKTAPQTAPAEFAAYASLDEVVNAGWLITGETPDPVALAAQVAFSQSPKPGKIYIAPIQAPESVTETAVDTIKRAMAYSGWYAVCPAGVAASEYASIAQYIETQEKVFIYTETAFFTGGKVATIDNTYFRTIGIVGSESASQKERDINESNKYMNVAFAVKWFNYEPGTETAAYKQLSVVKPGSFTTDDMNKLSESGLNYFITVGSKNITVGGMTMGGEWMDVIRFRDWLKNDMQTRVVNLFVTNSKIPFTDAGIALIQNQMLASLKAGQDIGGIAEDEFDDDGNTIVGYETSVPTASSLTSSEKASRKLTGLTFKARLSGAIHFAELNGSLTYEL